MISLCGVSSKAANVLLVLSTQNQFKVESLATDLLLDINGVRMFIGYKCLRLFRYMMYMLFSQISCHLFSYLVFSLVSILFNCLLVIDLYSCFNIFRHGVQQWPEWNSTLISCRTRSSTYCQRC